MNANLPVIPGRKAVKALKRAGFFVHRSTGSHLIMRHRLDRRRQVTIPLYSGDLKKGTLDQIVKRSGLSAEEFAKLL